MNSLLKGDNHTKKMFKIYRNKLTHIKEQFKKLYYNELITKFKHNSALIWKSINNITYRTKTYDLFINKIINENNHQVYDSKQICETLNYHFSDIGPRMVRNIHPPSNICKFTNLSLINNSLTSFHVNPIRTNEVFFLFFLFSYIFYPPITRKRSMRYTSSLRSCRPSVYHTKMGESR